MKGLVIHAAHDLRYEEVPDPTPFSVEGAVVQVTQASICGSDLHVYEGHMLHGEGFCIGHEAIGVVAEVGSGVRHHRVGDRVLVPAAVGCGGCLPCRHGDPVRCERGQTGCYGLGPALPGSQAEAVSVPIADANLLAIPDGVSDDNALLLTDCAATAYYGCTKARIGPGDTVAIVGLGPIGLVAIQEAYALGASRVIGIDPVAERRARAEALGAEAVSSEGAKDAVHALVPGGVDRVVEAVGRDDSIALAVRLVRTRGSVAVVGVTWSRGFDYPLAYAQMRSIDFHIGLAPVAEHLPVLFDLVRGGRIDPSVVISHRLPLAEGAWAYEQWVARAEGICKVVFTP